MPCTRFDFKLISIGLSTRASKRSAPRGAARLADIDDPLEPALDFLRELWALDHALGSTSKRMLDAMGVTAQQRMILRFIGKYPDINAVELAAMLHIEKSTLSIALKRLEERQLVKRTRVVDDGRRASLALTPRGRAFLKPVVGTVERAVASALAATSARDQGAVRDFLQLLVRHLGAHDTTRRRR